MGTSIFALLIPIIAIVMGCMIAIIAIITSSMEKREYYKSVTRAIEAGKSLQEIKEFFGNTEDSKVYSRSSDPYRSLKQGIMTIAVGLGIGVIALAMTNKILLGIGGLVCLIGLGYLVIYFLQPKTQNH